MAHKKSRMRGRIAVARVGQLCGDTKQGVWNASEAWPLMLSSVKATGTLPDLQDEPLNWLPVDVAAEAIVQVGGIGPGTEGGRVHDGQEEILVYHILNPHRTPHWRDLLGWLRRLYPDFTVVHPQEWVNTLENLMVEHPAKKLLWLWKGSYGSESISAAHKPGGEEPETKGGNGSDEAKSKGEQELMWAMDRTNSAIPAIKHVRPLDEELFAKIWRWIYEEMIADKEARVSIP